jgi:hypothetical protein
VTFDVVEATEAGRRRTVKPPEPRPLRCSFCGWSADKSGRWLRLGDDRVLHHVGSELICGLCCTPAEVGSRASVRR